MILFADDDRESGVVTAADEADLLAAEDRVYQEVHRPGGIIDQAIARRAAEERGKEPFSAEWTDDRRVEVERLRELLIAIEWLNSGNRFLEKAQAAIETARRLNRTDYAAQRLSFVDLLLVHCGGWRREGGDDTVETLRERVAERDRRINALEGRIAELEAREVKP